MKGEGPRKDWDLSLPDRDFRSASACKSVNYSNSVSDLNINCMYTQRSSHADGSEEEDKVVELDGGKEKT